MTNYTSICLSKKLIRLIDKKIEGKGFTSRAEFVRFAIRNELQRWDQ